MNTIAATSGDWINIVKMVSTRICPDFIRSSKLLRNIAIVLTVGILLYAISYHNVEIPLQSLESKGGSEAGSGGDVITSNGGMFSGVERMYRKWRSPDNEVEKSYGDSSIPAKIVTSDDAHDMASEITSDTGDLNAPAEDDADKDDVGNDDEVVDDIKLLTKDSVASTPEVNTQSPRNITSPNERTAVISDANTSNKSCPDKSPHLIGNLTINKKALSWEEVNKLHPDISPGGVYHVTECRTSHRVAIVIPYRNRDSHLRVFLHHMLPILVRQQVDFTIYVIEQLPGSDFNRGILMNIGFAEALKREPFPCFVFSDVDLWLENDYNIYGCPPQPRHLSVSIDKFHYKIQPASLFGGIENFQTKDFKKVNGFSNLYFGWGGEDNDIYQRVKKHGLKVIRPPREFARYKMARHQRADRTNPRQQLLRAWNKRTESDGLSSLQYEVKNVTINPLYTRISVTVDQQELLKIGSNPRFTASP